MEFPPFLIVWRVTLKQWKTVLNVFSQSWDTTLQARVQSLGSGLYAPRWDFGYCLGSARGAKGVQFFHCFLCTFHSVNVDNPAFGYVLWLLLMIIISPTLCSSFELSNGLAHYEINTLVIRLLLSTLRQEPQCQTMPSWCWLFLPWPGVESFPQL